MYGMPPDTFFLLTHRFVRVGYARLHSTLVETESFSPLKSADYLVKGLKVVIVGVADMVNNL